MKCCGCGVKLQSIDKSLPGFIESSILSSLGEESYCSRCYNIIHYGKHFDPILSNKDYYNKIDIIKDTKSIILLIVDVLNIESSFIPNMDKHIGNNPVIICVNKIDILPKDVHLHNIEQYIRHLSSINNINLSSVVMMSSLKNKNIDLVLNKIEKLKSKISLSNKEVIDTYVLGCASTGKSTFINTVKKMYSQSKTMLTTSSQYQTTLDFIKVPYLDKEFLIDTPGFINYSSYGAYLSYESQEILSPKSYIKPRTYQLNSDQTIFLGGLARVDFFEGEKINVSFYVSNKLYLHRTKTLNATDCYSKNVKTLLMPPINDIELEKINNFKEEIYNISNSSDLFISGLGFIHITGINIKIKVYVAKDIKISLIDTII